MKINVLAEAVREVNPLDPDPVMTGGDIVQGYAKSPQWDEQAVKFKSVMARLNCP